MSRQFNIRVYAIIINDQKEVLLADEERFGRRFTKFPGGGLEFGEGTIDCVKREIKEELNQNVEQLEHYYTTDFFQQSVFNEKEQLISIYYKVKIKFDKSLTTSLKKFDFKGISDEMISLRWLPLCNISEKELTFPIDKRVAEKLKNEFKIK